MKVVFRAHPRLHGLPRAGEAMGRPDASVLPPQAAEALAHCWGCGPANERGVHLEPRREGDLMVVDWQPTRAHAGWDTVVHGGLLAAFIDEVAAFAFFGQERVFGMTRSMSVQYHRRVHWTKPVRGEGRVLRKEERRAVVEVRLLQDGHVGTSGTVEFALMPEGPPARGA